MRVALLGEIAYPIKGARNYLKLLERTRHLPIEWHVFGEANRFGYADALRALNLGSRLVLHGPYRREEIFERLANAEIDLMLFLPPWPETFSYTLSEALSAGVPAIATDQGALPERIREGGLGAIVRTVDEAAATLERLINDPEELRGLQAAASRFEHRTLADMADAYRPIYDEMLMGQSSPTPLTVDERREFFAAHRRAVDPAPIVPAAAAMLPHYHSWWYPLYLRVASLTPAPVRRWGRQLVAARLWKTVRRYRFGRKARMIPNDGLELIRASKGKAAYRVVHADPSFLFPSEPFSPRHVRIVRFEMRCQAAESAYAQLYWSHRTGEHFSEEKSIRIPVGGDSGGWREYTLCIDQTDRRDLWEAGEEIQRLRFDPLNAPGKVELREFRLCAVG